MKIWLPIKTSNAMHESSNIPSLNTSVKVVWRFVWKKKLKHYRGWIGILLASVFIIIFALFSLATQPDRQDDFVDSKLSQNEKKAIDEHCKCVRNSTVG